MSILTMLLTGPDLPKPRKITPSSNPTKRTWREPQKKTVQKRTSNRIPNTNEGKILKPDTCKLTQCLPGLGVHPSENQILKKKVTSKKGKS